MAKSTEHFNAKPNNKKDLGKYGGELVPKASVHQQHGLAGSQSRSLLAQTRPHSQLTKSHRKEQLQRMVPQLKLKLQTIGIEGHGAQRIANLQSQRPPTKNSLTNEQLKERQSTNREKNMAALKESLSVYQKHMSEQAEQED